VLTPTAVQRRFLSYLLLATVSLGYAAATGRSAVREGWTEGGAAADQPALRRTTRPSVRTAALGTDPDPALSLVMLVPAAPLLAPPESSPADLRPYDGVRQAIFSSLARRPRGPPRT
jgi:hypothetical protein